ncbi:TlpA family protein disulfide reductase [Catellatospora vulcania]|uniref:TlpA family protein disulfide reductase n=1 Tax=Catellatospora vulcania TaxID=1460450 RepID=UPI0012D49AA4|nr:thioredoxin family protein [Catellatospora vulcania]
MDTTGLLVGGVALLAATAYGLVHRRRTGRVRAVPASAEPASPVLADLGVPPGEVTLLQFSSAFCAPCRATRVVCAEVARNTPGVAHVEVDAESRLDAVRALDIWKTPTVLIVDAQGRIAGRAQGAPTRAQVLAAVAPLLPAAAEPTEEKA